MDALEALAGTHLTLGHGQTAAGIEADEGVTGRAPLSPPTVMAKAVQPPLLKAQEVVVQEVILVTDMMLFLSSGVRCGHE